MRRSAICYTIGDMEDGSVLGQFLKAKGFSHRLAVRIKAAQGLAVDGIAAYAGYRLKTGQTVEVTLPEEEDSGNIVPVKLPLSIVYEDEDILVINKDAGVPIHPPRCTLGWEAALEDAFTASSPLPFSRARIQVIIFVVLAMGRIISCPFPYRILPVSPSIRTAD